MQLLHLGLIQLPQTHIGCLNLTENASLRSIINSIVLFSLLLSMHFQISRPIVGNQSHLFIQSHQLNNHNYQHYEKDDHQCKQNDVD